MCMAALAIHGGSLRRITPSGSGLYWREVESPCYGLFCYVSLAARPDPATGNGRRDTVCHRNRPDLGRRYRHRDIVATEVHPAGFDVDSDRVAIMNLVAGYHTSQGLHEMTHDNTLQLTRA